MAQKWRLGEDYIAIGKEINELEEEILRSWSRLTSPRTLTENVRSQRGVGDIVGEGVARAVDMEKLLQAKISELCMLREEAEAVIAALPSKERRLLRLRYFHGRSWQEIAMRLHYDESTCRRIHRVLVHQVLN